jgi:hypothetical protein
MSGFNVDEIHIQPNNGSADTCLTACKNTCGGSPVSWILAFISDL